MKALILCLFLSLSFAARASAPFGINLSFFELLRSCALPLHDPEEGLKARRDLFRAAHSKISISYYAFDEDFQNYEFLALVSEAADRGVKVEIIFDSWTSKISLVTLAYLESKNVEIKYFNPPRRLRNVLRINNRKHDKYMVVDDDFILVGGRNLKDGYFRRSEVDEFSYFDMDAVFRGESAREGERYFQGRWGSRWVEKALKGSYRNEDALRRIEEKVEKAREFLDHTHPAPRLLYEMSPEEAFQISHELKNEIIEEDCRSSVFYSPDPQRAAGQNLERTYIQLVNAASDSIDIVNPYVVLTKRMSRALKTAVKRGVRVRIITNSLQTNDEPLAQAAYLNDRKSLIKAGIEIYEFFDELWTLHSKVALFDERVALIGSFNLDPRSARLNSEVFLTSSDPEAVSGIAQHIEATRAYTKRIGKDGRPDGVPYKHPHTTRKQRIRNKVLQVIAPFIRWLI